MRLVIPDPAAQNTMKQNDDALYYMIWRSHALHAALCMPDLRDRHTPE